MAPEYVGLLCSIPCPVSPGSTSPLLSLPIHPFPWSHWLVSQQPYPVWTVSFSSFGIPGPCGVFPNTSIPIVPSTPRIWPLTHLYRLISLSVTTPIDCQALFGFIQWAGNTTIGASSSLLLVRTIAVWNRSRFVIFPMLLLAAGQWGLLYYSQSKYLPF